MIFAFRAAAASVSFRFVFSSVFCHLCTVLELILTDTMITAC